MGQIGVQLCQSSLFFFWRCQLGPLLAQQRLFENIVAKEDLVCAFARQDHFDALGLHTLGQQVHWYKSSAEDWHLGMPERLWKGFGDRTV
jgi:hypothetical protein